MGKTKVFVGNLSFNTKERDLQKEFEAAGKVASASIITRGSRSLGYGFVEMESEEDAKKAVELLNKKLIDSREINVEIARPREEKPAAVEGAAAPAAGAAGGDGAVRGRGAAGRGGRSFRGRRPRGRGGKPVEGGSPSGAPAGDAKPTGERRPRPARVPRPVEDKAPRTPSSDTLFVTNLPFAVDDAGLAAIFAGLNIKAAHVVRKHNERSKGFGFVEFNNADDQQKALAAIDKKSVEGRELVVKVALTEVAKAATAPAAAAPASPATETKN